MSVKIKKTEGDLKDKENVRVEIEEEKTSKQTKTVSLRSLRGRKADLDRRIADLQVQKADVQKAIMEIEKALSSSSAEKQ